MCNDDVTVIIEKTELFTTIVIDDNCEQVTIIAEALGAQGLSAYDIAVANGFVGTEAEWLESLKAKTFIRRHDFVTNVSYCGYAEEGSLETDSVWNISKIVVSTVGTTTTTTATDVTDAKDEIIAELANIDVDNEAIANEVWNQEPERLKQVATVETTGDQLASFNNA